MLALAGCDRGESRDPQMPETVSGGPGMKAPTPGTGLQGGLGGTGMTGNFPSTSSASSGTSTQAMGGAPDGSRNLTSKGSVGNRP